MVSQKIDAWKPLGRNHMKSLLFLIAFFAGTAAWADEGIPITKVLEHVRKGKPQTATFVIAWKEVEGIKGSFQWTIEGTKFCWVKLYPENSVRKNGDLDKKKKYRIDGVLLEQWYGVYQVWVYDLKEAKDEPKVTPPKLDSQREPAR
jgi:hypothetical protein